MSSESIMSRLGIICPCFKPILKRKGTYSFDSSPGGTKVNTETNGIIVHSKNNRADLEEADRRTRERLSETTGGLHDGQNGEIKHREELHMQVDGARVDGQKDTVDEEGIQLMTDGGSVEGQPKGARVAEVSNTQSRLEQLLQAEEEPEGERDRCIVGRDRQRDGEEVQEDLVQVESAAGLKVHSSIYGSAPARPEGGFVHKEPEYTDYSEMTDIAEVFSEISRGGSEIDAYQLQNILKNCLQQDFEFAGFSEDLCRSMVAMHDSDLSGRLSYEEFESLWTDLQEWKEKYAEHDADNNGYFDTSEFSDILEQIGLTVSDNIMHALTIRYSDREGHIRFDDFLACAVKLKIAIITFHENSEGGEEATFTTDQFIQLGMYS